MYLDASLSLKQTLARNAVVEDEKNEMIKRLAVVEKRLKESTGRLFCSCAAVATYILITCFTATHRCLVTPVASNLP